MSGLSDFRQQHPEYNDMSDAALADALYKKFYSDMPRAAFDAKMGLGAPKPAYAVDRAINAIQGNPNAGWFDKTIGLPVMRAIAPVDRFTEGATSRIVNAATMGFGDEAAGAGTGAARVLRGPTVASTVAGQNTPAQRFQSGFNAGTANDRLMQAQFGQQNPKLATTLDILGAFGGMTPGPAAAIPAAAETRLGRAGTYLLNMSKGAATGAAFGGASAFGNAQGTPAERLPAAAQGAKWGAIVGAATQPVADIIGAGVRFGKNLLGVGPGSEAAAKQAIIQAAWQDGYSIPDAIAWFDKWKAAGAKPETMMEMGDAMRRLARSVYTVGGKGASELKVFLDNRAFDAPARIATDLEDAFKTPQGSDTFAAKEALDAARQKGAGPLYDQAYAGNPVIKSPEVDAILKAPTASEALTKSERFMKDNLLPAGDATTGYSLQQLDYAKQALDDKINNLIKNGYTKEAGVVIDLKNRLLAALDQADTTGTYAAARAAWSGPTQSMGAVDAGSAAVKGRGLEPEKITAQLNALNPGDQQYYKMGIVRELIDQMGGAGGPNKMLSAFGPGPRNARLYAQVQAAFPDQAEFEAMANLVGREANMMETPRTVLGGSQSINKLADVTPQQEAWQTVKNVAEPIYDIGATGFSPAMIAKHAARWAGRSIMNAATGMTQEQAAILSPWLTSTNPTLPLNQMLDQARLAQLIAQGKFAGQAALPAPVGLLGARFSGR